MEAVQVNNHHFRNLPSRVFFPHELTEEFHRFYDESVRALVRLTGYKLDQKHGIAKHIVHNLIVAAFPRMSVVSDPRDTATKAAARVPIWDAIVAAGLADVCIGSENTRTVTRYRASAKLLELRKIWELRLVSEERSVQTTTNSAPSWLAPVVLHTGTVNPQTGRPLPKQQQRQLLAVPRTAYFVALEDLIERINRSNTSHAWQAFAVSPDTGKEHVWEPSVRIRQIHVGKLFRGARLYTGDKFSAQNMSKADREKLLIDGEPVCELDFSCMAIRMLYHCEGLDPKGDLYRPRRAFPVWYAENDCSEQRAVVRDFLKRVTNIALNVNTRKAAVGAISNLLTLNPEERLLRSVLRSEGLGVGSLLDRVVDEVHGALEGMFYGEKGLELMTADGAIMLDILTEFVEAGKPCLPLHDGVVVKASDYEFARKMMRRCYRKRLGYYPVIQRSF